MMRADPYLEAESIQEVKSGFRKRLCSILNEHKDSLHHLAGTVSESEQITDEMCRVRLLPWKDRASFYRENRIDEQRTWYARKSAYNRQHGRIWFGILVVFQALAVLFVILRVGYPDWGYWPSEVFLVAAGAALTWIQVKKFRELESVCDDDGLAQFVVDSENAFSREHTQWLARKDSY